MVGAIIDQRIMFKDGIIFSHIDCEYEEKGLNPLVHIWKDNHNSILSQKKIIKDKSGIMNVTLKLSDDN